MSQAVQDPSALLSTQASTLLRKAADDHWGDVSPSVYETARLVADAPWLSGHLERVRFLLATQRADGTWSECVEYALVPTLSACRALLSCLRSSPPRDPDAADHTRVLHAADAALSALRGLVAGPAGRQIPDTIAVELVVPALVSDIREHLEYLGAGPYPHLCHWSSEIRLPSGISAEPFQAIHARVAAGQRIPEKFWHAWETLGGPRGTAPYIRPAEGAVGGSPAATAVWFSGSPSSDHPSLRYLDRLQRRAAGPVPSITPITYFERSWLLSTFATAGLPCEVPEEVLDSLENGLTPDGAPAGPGLPPDSDDTAAVLLALGAHGRLKRPDALMGFLTDGYFLCFVGERTPSTTTNAHVLETLAHHTARRPADLPRYRSAMTTTAQWLLDMQRPDGSWEDKWHASPYYATVCCALALVAHGTPPGLAAARKAADWVLSTQRPDGGWGRWHSTVEETSYALRILSRTPAASTTPQATAQAKEQGRATLLHPPTSPYTPLWHDKDLYAPVRVIQAARLAALHSTSKSGALADHAGGDNHVL